jgi:hypothetical protein
VREYLDNNVAVAARLSSPVEHLDPRTIVEAVPGGWFYLAALPGNEVIVVFITLATLVPSEPRVRLRWWLEALSQTTVVRNTLNGHRLPETLSVANARASFCSIRCRRPLACDRRSVVWSRHHLGDRRRWFTAFEAGRTNHAEELDSAATKLGRLAGRAFAELKRRAKEP